MKGLFLSAALVAGLLLAISACSDTSSPPPGPAAGTDAAMLIEPKVSVGKIHAGMTREQVVAELGPPERQTATALEYPRLGLAVMPGPDGVIRVVMCGDVTGINGPFVKAFKGRTKENIGMNSTRGEIITAYGEPGESEKMHLGLESLKYPDLGFAFTLDAGKVHHIIVRLGGAEATPPPAISVDTIPAPTSK